MKKKNSNESKIQNPNNSESSLIEGSFMDNYEKLKSYVARYINRPHDVEDIVQETFVKTYQAQKKTKIANMKAYFYTTARNLSFKHNAKHSNKITDYIEDLGLTEVLGGMQTLEEEMQAHEQFSIFCEAVRELPLQCRRVFILKKIYGLPYAEISSRLQISISTVNQHMAKGILRCTEYMREQGYLDNSHSEQNSEQQNGN